MNNKPMRSISIAGIIMVIILCFMFLLMIGSIWNESAIIDEIAHIPAGFGYITQFDFRLNPEHPPLIKALAAVSGWLGARPYFPTNIDSWTNDINGQWTHGSKFLYESGNDADAIVFWSRFPLIILSVLFGWLIFRWTSKRFGNAAGLISATLFALSPTVLAHARYVTTDLGAALGFFIGITSFVSFLERPSRRSVLIAGLCLGIAQLLKFSLVLLIPFDILLLVAWALTRNGIRLGERLRLLTRLTGKAFVIGCIALAIIWAAYAVFTWNYPQAKQVADTDYLLSSYSFRPPVTIDYWLASHAFTRPIGHYVLGVLMVQQRALGGNTSYFIGDVTNRGSRLYFPLLYVLKETLPLHILTVIAICFAFSKMKGRVRTKRTWKERIVATSDWVHRHFFEFACVAFIAFYWFVSIRTPLNIGVRHLLPTFPFIYMLVGRILSEWLSMRDSSDPQSWSEWWRNIYQMFFRSLKRWLVVSALLLWLVLDAVGTFPSYLAFYNGLVGTRSGYLIAVDSNYDWGQDLKRLADYVERHNIQKISIDYFGGGNPAYYMGDKAEYWWSAKGPASGWFALSASTRQGAFGTIIDDLVRKPEDSYEWLKGYVPVARAGQSIFIYKLP